MPTTALMIVNEFRQSMIMDLLLNYYQKKKITILD